ncbi:MAG: PAS domain S-box protein, partial [Phycisphaerae bacterium]
MRQSKIPKQFIWAVVAICALPTLLNLLGLDFGSAQPSLDLRAASRMAPNELVDALHHSLAGSFTHTLLEWSAFCTAIFTVILAFVHFKIKRDVVTPIIGVALFWAGCMDAFHTLAADRLIQATADNRNLIPFTWAICRLFNALIPIVAVALLLVRRVPMGQRSGFYFVSIVSLAFGLLAYGIINICATSNRLPETMFPNSTVTRPWDIAPLGLYLFSGAVVYPLLHRWRRDLFSLCLWLSVIPDATTQFHMAFGSTALFDNHFNIAHFLKIMAYLVPFAGLCLDYVRTYRQQSLTVAQLQEAQAGLADSETRTRAILENAADAIITTDEQGTIESFNAAAQRIFGYTPEEMLGKNLNTLIPAARSRQHHQHINRCLPTDLENLVGTTRQVAAQRKDGTRFPAEIAISDLR